MTGRAALLAAWVVASTPSVAPAAPIEVLLGQKWLGQRVTVRDAGGRSYRLEARAGRLVEGGVPRTKLVLGSPSREHGFEVAGPDGPRAYPGALEVRACGSRLELVDRLDLERYVASVVTSELPAGWPPAALEAQAVLARTLAVRGGPHQDGRFCDLTHCQHFSGRISPEARQATERTRGEILLFGPTPIRPLYFSTCGGHRAANATIFGGQPVAYLTADDDPYCQESPHAGAWSARIDASRIARALERPEVRQLTVLDRDPGGWVAQVAVDGQVMTGYRLWQALGRTVGWGKVKSLAFTVRREGDRFVFVGRGLGHGVGLCQWGARGRARAGWDYRHILRASFPGTRLGRHA